MVNRIRLGFCRAVALWVVALVTIVSPAAQTPPNGSHLEFEVASVKRVEPPAPAHAVGLNITPGRLLIEAATLRRILGLAYAINRVRVIGGPPWVDSDQYTVTLNGSYDFSLEMVTATGDVVSPFTAVQEQLGLKLEPTKAPMEVLIIDRAERPTPN
jgi:uncharacterized protein DUF3738